MTTRMTSMNRLGLHLIGAALAFGAVTHIASAQNQQSTTAPAQLHDRNAEQDMLARARAERERHRYEASQAAPQDGDAIRDSAIQAEVDRRIREAEREAELDAVTAAIRRSAAGRQPDLHDAPPLEAPEVAAAPQEDRSPDAQPPATAPAAPTRATVLLSIAPGRTGIRALAPTADPILCMPDVCWISRGPDRDARMVPRRKALGPLNTLGARAGACNDSVDCVFRNIELTGASTIVQPVDLRILKHDRRAPLDVRVDTTCHIERRTLACAQWQSGGDYRLWVVPEAVAREAGGGMLSGAMSRRTTTAQRPPF